MDARTNELPLEFEHEYSDGSEFSRRSSARPSIGATDVLETLRRSWRFPLYGFLIGLAGAGLLLYTKPFGVHVVPTFVYAILVGAATLFGAWEGGLVGIDSENKKLAKFHDDLVAGKYLILVYVRKHREQVVLKMMREKHPDAELVAIDSHFINPFSSVRRVPATPTPGV